MCFGGGGGGSSTTQNIPRELKPLFEQTGNLLMGLQPEIAAQFDQFFASNPQQIPGLTGGQQALQDLMMGRAFGNPYTDPEQYALDQIKQLTGGPLGSSPATLAAMQAIRTPVLNDLALAGLGNSDAVDYNLTAAYAPILAQEMAQRAGLVGTTAGIGNQVAGRTTDLINQAFAGQEAGRSIEEAQQQSIYQDFLRRMGLGQQFTTGLLGSFPVFTRSTSTSGGGTVICTELHRQGYMDDDTYEADREFGQTLTAVEYLGYRLIADPIVEKMKKSKRFTAFVAVFGCAAAREMKKRVRGGKGSWLGKLILDLGLPLCRIFAKGELRCALRCSPRY